MVLNNKIINYNFFFEKNGLLDIIPKSLNCLYGSLYFHCRLNEVKDSNLATMFLHEMDMSLIKNNNKIKNICSSTYLNQKFLKNEKIEANKTFKITSTESKGFEALQEIERLLGEGKLLSLDTFCFRLPFYYSYKGDDCEYNENDYQLQHFILLVGQSEDEVLYIEDPDHINHDNFQRHKDNENIGIIKKKDLLNALNAYSIIYEVEIDPLILEKYTSFNYYQKKAKEFMSSNSAELYTESGCYYSGGMFYTEILNMFSLPHNIFLNEIKYIDLMGASSFKMMLSWQFHDVLTARRIFLKASEEWEFKIINEIYIELVLLLKLSVSLLESMCSSVGCSTSDDKYIIQKTLVTKISKIKEIDSSISELLYSV